MASHAVKVMANGRMSLPASVRRRLGLSGGGTVLVEDDDRGVQLRTVDQAIAEAQRLTREHPGFKLMSVDNFLAWRKTDGRD